MLPLIMKMFGIVGLLLITWGIWIKEEKKQDWIFAAGGAGLLAYSLYLKDPIFIPLQIIFIASSLYELYKKK